MPSTQTGFKMYCMCCVLGSHVGTRNSMLFHTTVQLKITVRCSGGWSHKHPNLKLNSLIPKLQFELSKANANTSHNKLLGHLQKCKH